MEKTKSYRGIKFTPRLVRRAIDKARAVFSSTETNYRGFAQASGERWSFVLLEEFLGAYNDGVTAAQLTLEWKPARELSLMQTGYETFVTIQSPNRKDIEAVSSVFEEAAPDEKTDLQRREDLKIFIGHGRSREWIELKSHLQDKHRLDVEAYETGARAGHTIRDILEAMAADLSFALLVLTGEDETKDGVMRARQNVIHETGLFQGRLGFDRAIMVVENGVELASNFDGIQQIRFDKGRIQETFGEVLATLKREFGPI